jgi:hypothetical protein
MDMMISTVREVVDVALRDSNSRHVVVGPLVWPPAQGSGAERWYFTVATSDAEQGFRCDQVLVPKAEREEMRRSVLVELMRRRPPALVIHDMDDELAMARMCETLWPGERITALRRAVEVEYAQRV